MRCLSQEAGGTPPQIALGGRRTRKGQCAKAQEAKQTGENTVIG
jgi:hypothetical protein